MRPGTGSSPRDLRIDAVPGRTDFQVKVSLLVTTHRSRNSRQSSWSIVMMSFPTVSDTEGRSGGRFRAAPVTPALRLGAQVVGAMCFAGPVQVCAGSGVAGRRVVAGSVSVPAARIP